MNKVTKGALAAAAAGALLLGGVGTYASWSDSASLDAGDVSTGSLTMTATTDGWSYDGTNIVASPVIVPGDELTATYNVSVDTTGDNIEADLALLGETGTLPAGVDATYTVTPAAPEDPTAALEEDGAAVTFTDAASYDFTVEVLLTFAADLQESQLATIDLAGAELTLTQS